MALDFSNRNAQDANGIYSLDTTGAQEAWVKDNDWSQVYYSQTEARKAGANNKIRVATAITNDGRKFDVAIGADGSPISQIGDARGQDDDVATKWKQGQQAPPTRSINGVPHQVVGKDANGQDIWAPVQTTTGTATSTATQMPSDAVPRVEGTPLPGGGFDNEQPVQVWRRPDGTVVKTEPLTPDERKKWDEDRQRSRNPGAKSDSEIKTETDRAEATRKADDGTVVDVTYSGTGKNRKKVTTYKSGRKTTEDAATAAVAVSTTYDPDGTKVTKYDDGTETREQQNPVTTAQEGRAASADQRAAEKDSFGVEPDDAPPMTYTVGQLSSGLKTYSSWLSSQVKLYTDSGGKQGIKPAEATRLMERRIALAESSLREQEGLGNAQKGLLDNATTQRGQSLTETQSRRGTAERIVTNSQSNILPLVKFAGKGGGGLAVDAMNAALDRGRQYVDSFGGMRESPEVSPDSFPALAQLRQSAMAGIQTAAQGGPQIFDPRNPPTAPGAPAAPPVTGTPVPAATNPVSNTPVLLPPSRPSTPAPPPVAPPADAQAAANAGPVPGQDPNVWTPPPADAQAAANAGPVPGQDPNIWTTIVGAPAPQDYGRPGMNVLPQQTSQIGAVPVDAAAAGGGVMKTMSPRFMQEQRYGPGNFFDPEQRGAELMARLGIDPSIMKQAIGGMYG